MTAGVVNVRSRKRKDAAARAAKARKEKILLAVCGVVLLGLLALEGPKTLKKLHGSTPATEALAPSSPSAQTADAQAASTAAKASIAATKHLAAKDPFLVQLGTEATTSQEIAPVSGPAVRESHFVKKDPFVQQLSFAPTPATSGPTSGTGTPPATTPGSTSDKPAGGTTDGGSGANYIVMVASIPISDGRGTARAAAATARAQGIPSVKIVDSSGYPTLRTGFYAVYSGPYPTLDKLLPALEQVRGKGYPSAYTRRLAH